MNNALLSKLLNSLGEPAFFLQGGFIADLNGAAKRLCLSEGQPVEDLPLPDEGELIHLTHEFCGHLWDVTLQAMEGGHLALLHSSCDEDESLDLFMAAARGIQDPLTSMMAAGSTLFPRLEEFEDEAIQEQAGAISRGCFRLLRSLTAMTQFHRLQSETAKLYIEKTRVKEFFDALAVKWKDALLDSGIELEYHSPKNAFNCNLDRALVQRAVLCLLSNAADHRADGTPVELSVSYVPNFVKITVKNQGAPMTADVLATVFSRYNQPLQDTLDAKQGTGLSLPLARRIAQKHGGSLLLQSSASGTAVTMTIGLHLAETDKVNTPYIDPHGGYDPALIELSGVLPNTTYDSRNIDL